jgi:hypothetical protein
MSQTPRTTSALAETTGPSAAMTFESLAERLREGPLRTLLTMHVRAGAIAADPDAGADERLEKLVELVQLSRMATAQFIDFTRELQSLIDHLAAASGKVQ